VEKTSVAVKAKLPEHKVHNQLEHDVEKMSVAANTESSEHKVEKTFVAVNVKPPEHKVENGLGNTSRSILQQAFTEAFTEAQSHMAAAKYGLLFLVVLLALRVIVFRSEQIRLALGCRRDKDRSRKQLSAKALKVPGREVGLPSKLELSGGGSTGGPHLCPDLLVPGNSECTLMVPQLDVAAGSRVCISDVKGRPVLRATLGLSPVLRGCRANKLSDIQRLVLSSATGDATFAYCRNGESRAGGGRTGLVMHHSSEEPFGVLNPDSCEVGCGYSLIANAGWHIYFRIDQETGNVSAIDECGKLIAVAQPTATLTHAIRVGPQVDAGMIVLAVLGIGVLEGRASVSKTFSMLRKAAS